MSKALAFLEEEYSVEDRVSAIEDFEDATLDIEQADIPVEEYMHGGMYARKITIPANTVLTGQIYKFDHFEIMAYGDITVSDDRGNTKRLTGFNLIPANAGKKRIARTHEETVWITFHPFSGATGQEVQDMVTANSIEEFKAFQEEVNRFDFLSFLEAYNLTEEYVTGVSNDMSDHVDMPEEYDHIYLDKSYISGEGLFSKKNFKSGDVICPARIGDCRTIAGRKSNHALHANAEILIEDGSVYYVANRDIESGEEITVNYRKIFQVRITEGDLCLE